ncbi:hypothetical protein ASPBRDRAFT_281218 [Aspergillus brasiliensis CBS 101740]|uniref:Uncharacterized protein n=1 Tax=Aspergillus brasiliensis (strain CBS 101740 / IMI 381727 / IBT 21946) TaxID=767769 RepID=A0A1L9UD05_ASPBC|nr:hypothetical protein ASPBRDRAFT_281218 [Aspergillus brasiliensis CBS 101740]
MGTSELYCRKYAGCVSLVAATSLAPLCSTPTVPMSPVHPESAALHRHYFQAFLQKPSL